MWLVHFFFKHFLSLLVVVCVTVWTAMFLNEGRRCLENNFTTTQYKIVLPSLERALILWNILFECDPPEQRNWMSSGILDIGDHLRRNHRQVVKLLPSSPHEMQLRPYKKKIWTKKNHNNSSTAQKIKANNFKKKKRRQSACVVVFYFFFFNFSKEIREALFVLSCVVCFFVVALAVG